MQREDDGLLVDHAQQLRHYSIRDPNFGFRVLGVAKKLRPHPGAMSERGVC